MSTIALDKVLANMASDIERRAKQQVPHRKGTLQNTGRTKRLGIMKHQISFGEAPPASAPYARKWEYETPPHGFKKGRKTRYLRDSADAVTKNKNNYFKRAFSTIRI